MLLSNHFPDDHSVYHLEDGEGLHVDEDAASLHLTETERRDRAATFPADDEASLHDEIERDTSNEEKGEEDDEEEPGKTYEEISGGIACERDVEATAPELEKKKSAKSMKDPNLVSALNKDPVLYCHLTDYPKVTWESADDPANPKNCKCAICDLVYPEYLNLYLQY